MTLQTTRDPATGLHRVTRTANGALLAAFTTEGEALAYVKARTISKELSMKSKIVPVTTNELDKILLPFTHTGQLSTRYNRATTATEYVAGRRVIAVSVGCHHFAAA